MATDMKKRILFVHYRVGERDGVSLEIEKRAKIFQELGEEVYFLSGYDGKKRKNSFVIKELDITSNLNRFLKESFFNKKKKVLDELTAMMLFFKLENVIHKKLNKAVKIINPDLIFVHNVFSHAYNLPFSSALLKVLDKMEIPTVCVHHDFWFERDEFLKPNYYFINEIVNLFPPKRNFIIKHQVINSIMLNIIKQKRGIAAEKIGDYFDFKNQYQSKNTEIEIRNFFSINEKDLVVLHATRITPRKAIENAIYFVYELEKKMKRLTPLKINTNKRNFIFDKDSRVILFLPNFVEFDSRDYFHRLNKLAFQLKVKCYFAYEHFSLENNLKKRKKSTFNFFDSYLIADLVTYTSIKEGFGNQFLEAVFFKKPVVLFEYPVFESDIKKEGYEIISIGNTVKAFNGFKLVPKEKIKEAVDLTIDILKDKEKYQMMVEKNFELAKKFHDESFLKKDLSLLLKNAL